MFAHSCEKHGHRFKPRYSLVSPSWLGEITKNVDHVKAYPEELVKAYEQHYVCDICERCGQVIDARAQLQTGFGAIGSQLLQPLSGIK